MTLTEPQTWTALGVLAATLLGVLTLILSMMYRIAESLRGEVKVVGSDLRADIREVRTEFGQRIDHLDKRIDHLDKRIDHLDRDVQAIAKHVFRDDPRD